MKDKQELKQTHSQGFGGSDAKMFAKVGRDGINALSTTDIKRIMVVLGRMEAKPFEGNVYTEAGHLFEDFVADNGVLVGCSRERYIEAEGLADNFKVFAHADFYDEDTGCVFELKFSQDDTEKLMSDYYAQLQWYYMLGAKGVTLINGWGNLLPFAVAGYSAKNIVRDEQYINLLMTSIAEVDNAIAQGAFDDINDEELEVDQLNPETQRAVTQLADAMRWIRQYEKIADDMRSTLLAWMERNGVLNIKGDGFSVSYVAPTTRRTFDTKKAQEKHPELKNDDFYKVSPVKSSVKINLDK